ncbi:MAG: hypothetical protein ACI8ZM_000002 [Crocinitomix sp.]|jgi:hypothetical protein
MDELNSIKRRLKGFEKNLYGTNYECHFLVDKICNGTDLSLARELINKRFEPSWQKNQNLELIEYKAFIEAFSDKLLYRGDNGAGVKMTDKKEAKFKNELEEFNRLVKQKFNPSKSLIYIHPELTAWIFWGFCFLIVSKERNGIYLFEGISSD